MLYIDLVELHGRLPNGWEQRAGKALNEVRAASPDKRAVTINKHADLWQELGDVLALLSSNKCWYCESCERRSDHPIDHFRPKNRVQGCAGHEGYWWLAFDWHNYRYCCTYCNSQRKDRTNGSSGGKQDAFPLLDETKRAYSEADDLSLEEPELLDPTIQADPGFLWFMEDGKAVEKFSERQQRILYRRAHTSIDLYHLNHIAIIEARKALFQRIRKLVESGDTYLAEWDAGNNAAKHGLDRTIEELRQLMNRSSEYSAAARAMILGFRDHAWVDGVITAA